MAEHPLRGFLRRVEEFAKKQPEFRQAEFAFSAFKDHVSAMAGVHERNEEVMYLLGRFSEPTRDSALPGETKDLNGERLT